MSFLKRGINQEEPDPLADREEQYKQLFPKIARDFATREDIDNLLQSILFLIDPLGLNPFGLSNDAALALARRYQELLDKGKDGGESKRDLVPAEDMG